MCLDSLKTEEFKKNSTIINNWNNRLAFALQSRVQNTSSDIEQFKIEKFFRN